MIVELWLVANIFSIAMAKTEASSASSGKLVYIDIPSIIRQGSNIRFTI